MYVNVVVSFIASHCEKWLPIIVGLHYGPALSLMWIVEKALEIESFKLSRTGVEYMR